MRLRRQRAFMLAVALCALVVAAGAAVGVMEIRRHASVDIGPALRRPGGGPTGVDRTGKLVPPVDLSSYPVFPSLGDGYAIESRSAAGSSVEHLAGSDDGGRRWYLVGAPFPFPSGYTDLEFTTLEAGYVFGPAGLAVTKDGGLHWREVSVFGGTPQRVVPIGADVWATYAVCHGPPLASTPCSVHLAVSFDGGFSWHRARGRPPLSEARAGSDVLARVSPEAAYVVSFGRTGGGLAYTADGGRSWASLPDPCAAWPRVDMAGLAGGRLWMICGGPPVLGGKASAKVVLRSSDGGLHWTLQSSTGLGPPLVGVTGGEAPVGSILYAGQLSQLATISPERAWIGVAGVGVLASFDGGRRFKLALPIRGAKPTDPVGVTFDDAEDGFALAFHEGVWGTRDARHWVALCAASIQGR